MERDNKFGRYRVSVVFYHPSFDVWTQKPIHEERLALRETAIERSVALANERGVDYAVRVQDLSDGFQVGFALYDVHYNVKGQRVYMAKFTWNPAVKQPHV